MATRPPQRRKNQVRNIYPYVRCHVLRHTFEAVGAIPGIHLRPRYGTLVTWRCPTAAPSASTSSAASPANSTTASTSTPTTTRTPP